MKARLKKWVKRLAIGFGLFIITLALFVVAVIQWPSILLNDRTLALAVKILKGKGIVIREPSVVAVSEDNMIVAVGEEAREMIEKAVNLEPTNSAYLDSLGWVLFKLDQPAEALPHILKAIEHNDEPDATLYDHLGDIYAALKKTEKAREAWQKALAIEPSEVIEKKLKAGGAAAATKPPDSAPR